MLQLKANSVRKPFSTLAASSGWRMFIGNANNETLLPIEQLCFGNRNHWLEAPRSFA
jgi:hypothetical protein